MTRDKNWTFFSNHGHVYILLASQTQITLKQVAEEVGITERAVHGILNDLIEGNYILKSRVGRNNLYKAVKKKTLKHPLESTVKLKDILDLVQG